MPGIVGIVNFDKDPRSIDQTIKRMVKILHHTSPSEEDICILNHTALAAVRLKVYSFRDLVAEDKGTALAFWGYLWDQEDLRKRTGIRFENIRDVSIGHLLLTLYNKEGIDGLCNLNGRFVIAIWDKRENVLKLVSDRYGFCNLYYWVTSKRILFASEYKAIIWHEEFSKKIDEVALADSMALGYSTEDRTFFENIRLLPQASVATFKMDGSVSIKKYWDYSFHTDDDPIWTEEDYIDQFFEILSKAIRKQIDFKSNMAIALSGGLDSRTLANILHRLPFDGKVNTYTYGHPYCFDVEYGRRMASKLGYKHTYIPVATTYLMDHAERFVWLTEGTVNCYNAHMLIPYPFFCEKSIDAVMSGFAGDTLCGSSTWIHTDGIPGRRDDEGIIKDLFSIHSVAMKDEDMALYMKRDIYERTRGKSFEVFRARYFQCPTKNRYHRARYISLHQRIRRFESFNLYAYDPVAEVVSPFLDHEFVEFIFHVPAVLMIFQNLYKKMIVKHLQIVASVPHNEKPGLPLNASRIRKGLQWRWERLNRNPFIRATIGRRYAKMHDNYINSGEAIRTGSRDFVISHIKDNAFLAQFFNMDRVHKMLDDHMNGKIDEKSKITALLTFALWGKLFVDDVKIERREQ